MCVCVMKGHRGVRKLTGLAAHEGAPAPNNMTVFSATFKNPVFDATAALELDLRTTIDPKCDPKHHLLGSER